MEIEKKAKNVQFPTFTNAEFKLEHVKALADKHGISYSKMMQTLVNAGLNQIEGGKLGIGRDAIKALDNKYA